MGMETISRPEGNLYLTTAVSSFKPVLVNLRILHYQCLLLISSCLFLISDFQLQITNCQLPLNPNQILDLFCLIDDKLLTKFLIKD